jgi:hypothetical protein
MIAQLSHRPILFFSFILTGPFLFQLRRSHILLQYYVVDTLLLIIVLSCSTLFIIAVRQLDDLTLFPVKDFLEFQVITKAKVKIE